MLEGHTIGVVPQIESHKDVGTNCWILPLMAEARVSLGIWPTEIAVGEPGVTDILAHVLVIATLTIRSKSGFVGMKVIFLPLGAVESPAADRLRTGLDLSIVTFRSHSKRRSLMGC